MTNTFSRRFFLGGISSLALTGSACAKAPETSLYPKARAADLGAAKPAQGIEGLIANSGLTGEVSFAVADVQSGKGIESYRPTAKMPPASVAKSLTALYALNTLGGSHRFTTQVLATAPVQGGVLNGDLILAGGGDPTLDTDALGDMAARLKQSGLKQVNGKFIVYDGALPYVRSIDPQQPDHLGYSTSISGMALNYNRVHFEWRRSGNGYTTKMDARAKRYQPKAYTTKVQIVDRRLPVYAYKEQKGIELWSVARPALGSGGTRWLPVRKSALYAGDVFQTLMRAQGIVLKSPEVSRRLPAGTQALASHQSAPLTNILRDMLKFSNNLTAEMVGLAATNARGKSPGGLKASAAEMNSWAAAALGMASVKMMDHSGLSDKSHMTTQDLTRALVQVGQNGQLRSLMKPFLMRDANGRINKAHPIKVDAKTGTLNFVSGLGGYMTAPDGRVLAFSIFMADTQKRARIAKADREVPQGARGWNKRAKTLQQKLIERWGSMSAG